ncbi:hypothetical protein GH714_028819 [Hevea brasiliensis]|uniref:Uncharacterized protein n=1 Tax=Hevea brasiliensis TaxID=3981 RepID=A0A6A6LS31_HEVBR|nr:hypothetical protein GH714_028819 [Hevea brasiliensis]
MTSSPRPVEIFEGSDRFSRPAYANPVSVCIIAVVVEGHYATNIRQIKWLYLNLESTPVLEFALIVLMILLGKFDTFFAYCYVLGWKTYFESGNVDPQASSDAVNSVTDKVSILDIGTETNSKTDTETQHYSVAGVIECKCGMPYAYVKLQLLRRCTSLTVYCLNVLECLTFAKFAVLFSIMGLREAIKNGDSAAVKKLLSEDVDANYRDKQGLSVLHLAALFNRTDIAFLLMESGASLDYKNAQGETPLDCAPPTLQYKMRKKMEEHGRQGPHNTI